MEIALFIQNLQEERAEVALFIFTKQSDAHFNLTELRTNKSMSIQERFSQTDRALEEVPTWPNVSLNHYRHLLMSSSFSWTRL